MIFKNIYCPHYAELYGKANYTIKNNRHCFNNSSDNAYDWNIHNVLGEHWEGVSIYLWENKWHLN